MSAKKAEEQVPEGSVVVESVWNLAGFDPHAGAPEIATWRDATPAARRAAEKKESN